MNQATQAAALLLRMKDLLERKNQHISQLGAAAGNYEPILKAKDDQIAAAIASGEQLKAELAQAQSDLLVAMTNDAADAQAIAEVTAKYEQQNTEYAALAAQAEQLAAAAAQATAVAEETRAQIDAIQAANAEDNAVLAEAITAAEAVTAAEAPAAAETPAAVETPAEAAEVV